MIDTAKTVENAISSLYGEGISVTSRRTVSGGCINNTCRLELSNGETLFMKENRSALKNMFRTEATGLLALIKDDGPVVPKPLAVGDNGREQFILTSYIVQGRPGSSYWEDFGHAFAFLHKHHDSDVFGFDEDNYIGATPQRNTKCKSWIEFFATHRLGFQIKLAAKNGLASNKLIKSTETLISRLPNLIEEPQHPSILHGDLWGGNAMADDNGNAVIFDPAAYYGHNEADLAMTELFGSFDRRFYAAYNEVIPLSPEYPERKRLYGLYHILNHLNLFGSSYAGQAQSIVNAFV